MAKELFDAVQVAEDQADALLQDAQRSARELLKQTEAACTEEARKMAHEHRAMYQSVLEGHRASVNDRIDETRKARMAEQERQMSQARQKLGDAADLIYRKVWNHGDC